MWKNKMKIVGFFACGEKVKKCDSLRNRRIVIYCPCGLNFEIGENFSSIFFSKLEHFMAHLVGEDIVLQF